MFLVYVFVFLFGLIAGSFLNALIYRLEAGDSVFRGRSYCPNCKHVLAWHDLIPLMSFFLLQGRCRYCKKRISWQYPTVELATGLLFLLSFKLQISSLNQVSSFETLNIFYLWAVLALLMLLFVYDLKHYILPDKIVFPAIGLALGYRIFEFLNFGFAWDLGFGIWDFKLLVNPLLAALGAALFFFVIFLLSRGRAMGFGDVKLALFMGLFLGWPNILVALFAAFVIGGMFGIVLILLKKKGMKSEVPFGPFLITGTLAALFWGKLLVDWYFNLILV
jgi:prepilin signal peptidase PulO-like enzyme (type II secretory pathway)